jgi:hypothetical protein
MQSPRLCSIILTYIFKVSHVPERFGTSKPSQAKHLIARRQSSARKNMKKKAAICKKSGGLVFWAVVAVRSTRECNAEYYKKKILFVGDFVKKKCLIPLAMPATRDVFFSMVHFFFSINQYIVSFAALLFCVVRLPPW